ncbi:MAG: thiamine pyrophosphate-dependent enzyme [Frankia sp.]
MLSPDPSEEEPTISSVEEILALRPVVNGGRPSTVPPYPMVRMLPRVASDEQTGWDDGPDDESGWLGYSPVADDALLRRAYREMVLARRLDTEGMALQRKGELGLWTPATGQEAAQVGSALALLPGDYVFPSYREHAVALVRGVAPLDLFSLFRGADFGGWDPRALRFHPYTLVLATQTLHATGYARGVQLERRLGLAPVGAAAGEPEAVLVYFGDGAVSEGDTSEALAWAALDGVPLVFFCQNNQWAISTPASRQSATPPHRRAEGFGMPGVLVDGNDLLAVHAVTRAALDRARSGGGPTLIEAHTYRIGGHSSADDPTRYRSPGELETWRAHDPIARLLAHLTGHGLVDEAFLDETERAAEALVAHIRIGVPAMPDPARGRITQHVHPTDPRD